MKTITLRKLVREPRTVKGLTRAGNSVRVTDNGKPLWIIQPDVAADDELARRREMEEELAQVLRDPPSKIHLSDIVLSSRR